MKSKRYILGGVMVGIGVSFGEFTQTNNAKLPKITKFITLWLLWRWRRNCSCIISAANFTQFFNSKWLKKCFGKSTKQFSKCVLNLTNYVEGSEVKRLKTVLFVLLLKAQIPRYNTSNDNKINFLCRYVCIGIELL